jgi:hypothetical protein
VRAATTTTAAPTTTSTTTSTTTTTTTAATTTTTTPPDMVAAADLSKGSATVVGTQWKAGATLSLTGPHGEPITGATVHIQVSIYTINSHGTGTWSTTTTTATVGANGQVSISTGNYRRSGSNRVTYVEYTVQSVTTPEGAHWDGDQPSITIAAP